MSAIFVRVHLKFLYKDPFGQWWIYRSKPVATYYKGSYTLKAALYAICRALGAGTFAGHCLDVCVVRPHHSEQASHVNGRLSLSHGALCPGDAIQLCRQLDMLQGAHTDLILEGHIPRHLRDTI